MIKYADKEPNTKCIAVYIEALDSPEAFKSLPWSAKADYCNKALFEPGVKAFTIPHLRIRVIQMLNTISYSRNQCSPREDMAGVLRYFTALGNCLR